MHWVIQNDLYRERGYADLIIYLEETKTPYHLVKITPMVHRLVSADFDSSQFFGNLDDIPEVVIDNQQPIYACGSVTMSEIAKERHWNPGSFLNENMEISVWGEKYEGNCVNDDCQISRFDQVERHFGSEMFIRPVLDDKSFPGKVMNWNQYLKWKKDVEDQEKIGDEFAPVKPNTMVAVAKRKMIEAEYRFLVLDDKIITGSRYKIRGKLSESSLIDPVAETFARQMMEIWQPAQGFVLDIAMLESGQKVMDIGCMNSAGFYHSDIRRYVDAVNSMNLSQHIDFKAKF